MSYHKLTYHGHVRLLIYFEAISDGMLSMLSWSKDPSWRREEKEGKRHHRMNRQYHQCMTLEHLVHCATTGVNLTPSDEPTVSFLVASDELEKRSREDSSIGWTDGPLEWTVGLSGGRVWTRQRRAKMKPEALDEPTGQQRFIRLPHGSYQRGFGRGVFSTGWSDSASEHRVGAVVSTVMCGGGNG
jgi:hypothetical protein